MSNHTDRRESYFSIENNIADKTIKIINIQLEKNRNKYGPLRNSSINKEVLQRVPHLETPEPMYYWEMKRQGQKYNLKF